MHRAEKMMRMAMKDIPLAHDDPDVEVLYEDDHLIVVNKPANLLTAPKHRWEVRLSMRCTCLWTMYQVTHPMPSTVLWRTVASERH